MVCVAEKPRKNKINIKQRKNQTNEKTEKHETAIKRKLKKNERTK